MNKEGAKNCILGSIVATTFLGFGFGIMVASHPLIAWDLFDGLVIAITGLVVMFALLQPVRNAGYRLKVVTKGDENV